MALTNRTTAHRVLDETSSDLTVTDPDLLGSYAHDESRFTAHAVLPGAGSVWAGRRLS